MANHGRRVVFFDLDGTLHQQDMFGTFMRYLLRRQPLNALLVLPLLPVIGIALLVKGRAARSAATLTRAIWRNGDRTDFLITAKKAGN